MSSKRMIYGLALTLGLVTLGLGQRAMATLTYVSASSTATFTHDPDSSDLVTLPPLSTSFVGTGTLTPRSNGLSFHPTSTVPASPSYQFITTETKPLSGGSSVAKASVSHVTNSTNTGVKLAAGTGVTQSNPKGLYGGASTLRVDFDFLWNPAYNLNFGPPASGQASLAVGGTVGAGVGAFARVDVVADFYGNNLGSPVGAPVRSGINFTHTFTRADSDGYINPSTGVFSYTFSNSELLNGTGVLSFYYGLQIVGHITFYAKNEESPTDISLTQDGGFAAIDQGRVVPEPLTASLSMLSLAAAGLTLSRRRK